MFYQQFISTGQLFETVEQGPHEAYVVHHGLELQAVMAELPKTENYNLEDSGLTVEFVISCTAVLELNVKFYQNCFFV
jgi:hypothetical protein